jgi:molybdate/tungstate transport system substrate-binding protein
MRTKGVVCCLLVALLFLLGVSACSSGPQEKVELVVLEAGSLVVPFDEIEEEFEKRHPNVDVQMEGHGSIQVIRHITELQAEVDVAVVADDSLLPLLMYQAKLPESDEPYADWNIAFATNRLGIAYNPTSVYADEINAENWYEILSRPDVRFGMSDPRFDACGYRALMLVQLAQDYYGDDSIFRKLIARNFTTAIRSLEQDGAWTILVPELLEPAVDRFFLRGFSVQLLALLESGDLDYAFLYKSVAEQHGFKFLELPREIDLSDSAYADRYQRVTVKLDYQRFASVNPEFQGKPIVYGVTIPANAPHPDMAVEFIEFLLSPEGQEILTNNEHPPLIPPKADRPDRVPERLRRFLIVD